jgi:hypothetical protein
MCLPLALTPSHGPVAALVPFLQGSACVPNDDAPDEWNMDRVYPAETRLAS